MVAKTVGRIGMKVGRRQLQHYPAKGQRRLQLGLVVTITVALYYALYVGGGVAPLVMRDLHMSFPYLVGLLALANAMGAFASLLAGLADRFGRANLVVYGLLLVGGLTAFAVPLVHDKLAYAVLAVAVGFVEGIILVATPALIRDFSPQVGRATAMGFWTVGPVLGSLLVSAVNSATLPTHPDWRTQYVFCGAFCLLVWVAALLFLRELKPALRDQIMVNDRDLALNEWRALHGGIAADTRSGWRQMLRADLVGSALGVSLLLLVYYTTVAFGVIYLGTVFGFSPARANGLLNWSWTANALALIGAGVWSDSLRVRKPFMLAGGVGAAVLIFVFMGPAEISGQHPPFVSMAVIGIWISVLMGAAYATWMANFTETVEAYNPALTATGLAIWGWLLRLVVTGSFLALPHVIDTVTPLVEAGPTLAAYRRLQAAGAAIPPDIAARMAEIVHASAAAPRQWASWYGICAGGALVFVALIFVMKGRWSPEQALADERAHDAAVRRELARIG
jgi:MFS family permease